MSAELWTFLSAVLVAIIAYIVAPWVKAWIDKKFAKPEPPAAPSAGDRAINEIFDQLDEVKAELRGERTAHDATRSKYGEMRQRLARAETKIEALEASNGAKDEVIAYLRAEIDQLRQELRSHGSR